MDSITLRRHEWLAVARELDATYRESAPPGLRERIAQLLAQFPKSWQDEACQLELDPAAADVVRAIVQRGRGFPVDPSVERARQAALAEAEEIIREHQASPDEPSGCKDRAEPS
ncbi:MAG: hypothetical protein KatS3mg059_1716 [Thermomicrobiales bacterium]|nr:MAG: hypothetical protein KatS3mg059_1716 [Thermomicrobiales bacterium]